MRWAPLISSWACAYNLFGFVSCKEDELTLGSNAAFDPVLAHYRLNGYNGDETRLSHSFFATQCGANLSAHFSEPAAWNGVAGTAGRPVLVLTHGYPESSYIWRHVAPSVSTRVPLFIPDQPGYGLSTACCNDHGCAYDKRTYARAIMQAVREVYGDAHVVFAGHDRGARTMHRAAVDNNFPGITAMGFFAADIVPFVSEYSSFSNPFWAQNYFHWAFLPKGEFATRVIAAYGGGKFVHQILKYGSGLNDAGVAKFKENNAWTVYENFYNQLSVINASTFDYVAGATSDHEMERWDQGNGTKVRIPTHVMYSSYNLASAFDVEAIWANYTHASAGLTTKGIGGNRGHFIIEEAPEETIVELDAFLDRLGVGKSRQDSFWRQRQSGEL